MTRYADRRVLGQAELQRFFEAVDRHLSAPAKVILIGGAAIAIHGGASTTSDIDTFERIPDHLVEAARRAEAELGIEAPMSRSVAADLPSEYDSRLQRYLPGLVWLEIWVVERHDLVLSKVVRGAEHDDQQVEQLHAAQPLDRKTLLDRFRMEMGYAVGSPDRLRTNLLQLIERLYGELERVRADRELPRP